MSLSRKLAGARLNGPEAGGGNSDKGRAASIPPPPPAATSSKSKAPAPPPHATASKRKAALQLPGSSQTEYAVIPRKRPQGHCDRDLMTERQKEVSELQRRGLQREGITFHTSLDPATQASQSQQINATADMEGDHAALQVPRCELLDRIGEDEELPSTAEEMKIDESGNCGGDDDRDDEEPTLTEPAEEQRNVQKGDVRGSCRDALDQSSGQREQDPAAADDVVAAAAAVPMTDEPMQEGKAACKEADGVADVGEVSGREEGLCEKSARSSPGDGPLASETPQRKKQRRSEGGSTDDHGGRENKEAGSNPADASSPDHHLLVAPVPAEAPHGTAAAAPGPLASDVPEVGNEIQAAAELLHRNCSVEEAETVVGVGGKDSQNACGLSGGASHQQAEQVDAAGVADYQPSDTDVAALEVGVTQGPAPALAGGGCCAAQMRRSVALDGFLGSLAAGDWDGAGLQELCNAQSKLAVAMQRLSGAIASRGMAAAAHQRL